MSDAEHLIENAIMALERYPYEEAERYFMERQGEREDKS